jgi:formylglycine-generating enzyme required for sulfatase activity
MEYLDFELEISPGLGRDYPVAVIRSPAGEARETMRFPFDELALKNRLQALRIALLLSGGSRRRVLTPEEQTVQDFGKDLFDALVAGEVRSRFDVSRREAHQQGKGLRLKLRFLSPEMAALPWEFLYDHRRGEYLCLSKNTPTIRYLELPQPIQSLTVTPPLRILAMIANPEDLEPLDVARERQRIETAIQDLHEEGFVNLTWLPGQTWRDLMRAMRRGPWHIFHFTGHGGFDPHTDEGLLALADDQGKKHLLPATQLASLLADHHPLRLVLLNSCEGARGSELDIYSSTAAILVRRGVAAVLAMQHEITDRAAIEFARVFYEALADGLPVDTAATEARVAVNIAVNNSLEWGTPALYMRSPDGVLFELASIPPDRVEPEIVVNIGEPPPSEPTPLVARKGRLCVDTEPNNARVTFLNVRDEFSQGMELEPGSYHLEVSANGYETKREWLELKAGEDKQFSCRLSPVIIPPGRLFVNAEPQGAAIELLNIRAKFSQGMELEPGNYHVEVSADEYKPRTQWIELKSREDKHVSITLERIEPTPETEFTNSLGMQFVLIPAGTFQMGSGMSPKETAKRYGGEAEWYKPEHPQHQVTISQPFYLQTTPVTQEQWQHVMGDNPSEFKKCGKDCPVEMVSWDDIQEFMKKLNKMEKTDTYRLPTEAEWEYACRAGSTSEWCFGDIESFLGEYAWYDYNSQEQTHPVGQLKSNAWGLYDMHGNVWEWCQDWYGEYPAGPVTDPTGPASGEGRGLRGGSWNFSARYARSANRGSSNPGLRNYYGSSDGFRVAKAL